MPAPVAPLDLLGRILPDGDQTDFLLACLAPAPEAAAAWVRWRARHAPSEAFRGRNLGLRALSAPLAAALFAAGAPLDARDAAWLRAALLHEERRAGRYREILGEVLLALDSAGVPFLLSRGAAVAETVLPSPWLRHCHDVDLLVMPEHLDGASAALLRAGLSEGPAGRNDRAFVHARKLPVVLHTRALTLPLGGPTVGELAARATSASVLGVRLSLLAADDLLIHVCAHAFANPSRRSARWVCDAHEIVARRPGLDWPRLNATAAAAGLAAPLATTLGYLADAIGTPVPAEVRARLAEDAARATRFQRDLLVHAVRLDGSASLRGMWADAGARSRLTLLRWAVAPELATLRFLDGDSRRSSASLRVRHLVGRLRQLRARSASPG